MTEDQNPRPKVEKVLLENRFGLAETKRNQWFATVPEGVTPEDLLRPDYWAHVARSLRPYDEIIVANDNCEWRIVLLVEDAWHNGARVTSFAGMLWLAICRSRKRSGTAGGVERPSRQMCRDEKRRRSA